MSCSLFYQEQFAQCCMGQKLPDALLSPKKKAIWLTFQRENEAVAHHRGVKSKGGLCMSL